LYTISSVRSNVLPPLYKLKDLLKDDVPGFFYKEELIKSKPLDYNTNYFFVEKILKWKKVKGEKLCLVKYLFYGKKHGRIFQMNDAVDHFFNKNFPII